ncbi:MAG: chaperone modulator CbpM [Burkholderiales bacterium]
MSKTDEIIEILAHMDDLQLQQLVEASGLTEEDVRELIDYGVFHPVGVRVEEWRFEGSALVIGRRLARLQKAFELQPPGLALVHAFIERIDALERELRAMACEIPR